MTRLSEIKKRHAGTVVGPNSTDDIEWLLSERRDLERDSTEWRIMSAALSAALQSSKDEVSALRATNTRMREALEALVWRYEEVVRDPDLECSLSVGLEDFDLVNARKALEAEQ